MHSDQARSICGETEELKGLLLPSLLRTGQAKSPRHPALQKRLKRKLVRQAPLNRVGGPIRFLDANTCSACPAMLLVAFKFEQRTAAQIPTWNLARSGLGSNEPIPSCY